MGRTFSFVAGVICLAGLGVGAQQPPVMHAPDGGTREGIESIAIPTIPNAPFSAVVTTEWTKMLADGSTQIVKNHRTVARDSSGRVFQERRAFMPDGDKRETMLKEIDIQDPVLHVMYVCRPLRRMCGAGRFVGTVPERIEQPGSLLHGAGKGTVQGLGEKMVDGLELIGSHEVTTIAANAMGNQKAQEVVKEFWYSPQLGINVITDRFDPRVSAEQKFVVSGISQREPGPGMFAVPEGYRVMTLTQQ